jgi:hypothetical protein
MQTQMTTRKKLAIVVIGYLVAIVVAVAVVSAYALLKGGPDRQASGGMSAFGDSLLFLAVLCVASLPATGAALFFLRSYRPFWTVLSAGGIALAITGLAALVFVLSPSTARPPSALQIVADLSPIRALVAPLFALSFLLAGIFAPARRPRIILLLAAASEAVVFGLTLFHWLRPL